MAAGGGEVVSASEVDWAVILGLPCLVFGLWCLIAGFAIVIRVLPPKASSPGYSRMLRDLNERNQARGLPLQNLIYLAQWRALGVAQINIGIILIVVGAYLALPLAI